MKKLMIVILTLFLMTGCWDARQLRDITVVKSAALDKVEEDGDDMVEITLSAPIPEKYRTQERNKVNSVSGKTPRDARVKMESIMSEEIDVSKLRALLVSEELAQDDLYPPLDVFYRDPRSALAAKILIVEGKGRDIINLMPEDRPRTSELLADLIHAAENQSMIPVTNIQLICPPLFDRGSDAVIPYMGQKAGAPELKGVALFNDRQMTGTLSLKESSLMLLMSDNLHNTASFTEKVHDDKEIELENYLTFEVENIKRDISVNINKSSDKIEVPITIKLYVNVQEYPEDELDSQEKINELNKTLSKIMTEQFRSVAEKLQEYRSDALGIGRIIHAYDYKYFQNTEWKDVYPEADIQIEAEVEIVRHGVLY